ncbi:nitrate- and nitrite sensing domain-containing protein [Amycolatopsis sp. A133]|uniref:sensor histidine kinase n=1 Tax=Amycolatopsis sp. A133 TaxID=3064472 RepID=UPI0027E64A11|nr:nitrate- and nitrite sensing domain-containing protein [Amycolatopsis sp. A133]MDQ7804752.1 nitrate- and nitrite sensing domain-containing protein [Amycolatopsis sp. A133]
MRHGRSAAERAGGGGVLARLGIRGKLNLLLLPPLVAVVLVSVPFVLTQANSAGAAAQSAAVARNAQQLGGLMWQLQRERLLTAAFVATPSASPDQMVQQQKVVDKTVADVRGALGPDAPDELSAALTRIGSLGELRQNAARRGVALDSVARTYNAVVDAVIDSVRLVPQLTSDAEGTRELTALDALLRANEENSLRAMALIVTAVSPEAGRSILDDATQQAPIFIDRFVKQGDDGDDSERAALVVRVEQSDAGRRVDELAGQVGSPRDAAGTTQYVSDVLSAADIHAGQRKLVQERAINEIADSATERADSATRLAWTVGLGAGGLFLLVAFLAVAVSRSIAGPLRQLTTAATSVADLAGTELVRVTDTEEAEEQIPRLATIDVVSDDELGKLAAAFNRVQTTAAELVERQALTRRNTSLMFANVAKRTQNLVGRQLALIDEVERNEQDTRLLASLYRLDHLSTRLRRNADNLLVVSGTRDEARIAGPIELSTALRSALAEIEDYQRVKLGVVAEILLSSALGADLVLVFAELLENATSFSPPGSMVEVDTMLLADGACLVSIVDHGIGMTAEKLAEENKRLVERERLELAPTSVLGLFVVGRLARRHELGVELLATPTTGGVTARLTIPPSLFTHRTQLRAKPEQAPAIPAPSQPRHAAPSTLSDLTAFRPPAPEPARDRPAELPAPAIPALLGHGNGFRWFRELEPVWPAAEPDAEPAAETEPEPEVVATAESRGGLRRRVRGAQLPEPGTSAPVAGNDKPRHDPEATKAAMDGFASAFAKAAEVSAMTTEPPSAPPTVVTAPVSPLPVRVPVDAVEASPVATAPLTAAAQSRDGLIRRVPGAQLAPGLRQQTAGRPLARAVVNRTKRDPAAERAAFDAFAAGLAKAEDVTADSPPQGVVAGRVMERGEESRK